MILKRLWSNLDLGKKAVGIDSAKSCIGKSSAFRKA